MMSIKQAELVFIPAPLFSHLVAAVETAKLLAEKAERRLSVTILTMNSSKDTTLEAYIQKISSSNPNLNFITLPSIEGPPIPPSSLHLVIDFIESRASHVREILSDLARRRPVAAVVLDLFTTAFVEITGEFGLASYVFSTCGAGYLGFSRDFCKLVLASGGKPPAPPAGGGPDFEVTVPYFATPIPAKVMPGGNAPAEHPDNMAVGRCLMKLLEVKGIMVNTFHELEPYAVDAFAKEHGAPKIYLVGPILNSCGGENSQDVKEWLDNQPEKSVVYLCFGSVASLDEKQVREIALAIENCGYRFLWSLGGGGAVSLPEGFAARTKGVGRVIGWAAQAAVLAHAAVGAFVSHCGWNSILESVFFGVPIAALPMFAEQHLNAFELVEELGMAEAVNLGVAPPETAGAGEIGAAIRRVMGGGVRRKVEEMRRKGRAALEEGGSSYKAQTMFIEDVVRNIG